jgi:GH15 family glucan-1,4-alpha-glucosidase
VVLVHPERQVREEASATRGSAIGDHAIIGDGRTTALVDRQGTIDFLCWPRPDSPFIFGALLDPARGGHWRIAPASSARVERRYVESTNVLETRFETASGTAVLTDLMPVYTRHDSSVSSTPEHELLRHVTCGQGSFPLVLELAARPDNARSTARWQQTAPGELRCGAAGGLLLLRSTLDLVVDRDGVIRGRGNLEAGQSHWFSLSLACRGPAVRVPLGAWSEGVKERTVAWWRAWAARSTYAGPHRDAVLRSALALRLLIYPPSGAVLAAPTTSLPERLGGELNWDYRYCWLRDAALSVRALLGLGYSDEARAFVGWLLHSTRLTRPALKVLYDVFGERPAAERELPHLSGHRGSRPVRVGNAADQQLQLDIYGEVIDAAFQVCLAGHALDRTTGRLLVDLGRYVLKNWSHGDQGLWEPREPPAHHVHSRVLCWVALDRLVRLREDGAIHLGRRRLRSFEAARDAIRAEVEARGWNEAQESYTDLLDGARADASLLLLSWYEFHPPTHPRLRATRARIRESLDAGGGLLFRNPTDRSRGEGAFGICSFWDVEHLARGGAMADAAVLFDQVLGYQNDVGLFGEQIDPRDGSALGNFPQAFTHVGVISAALALEERARSEGGRP